MGAAASWTGKFRFVSSDGAAFYRHTSPGLVASVYREEDLEQLAGSVTIGHNRYSTSGAADGVHSQPVFVRKAGVAFAHNGNLPITDKLEAFLDERDVAFEKLNDSEMMAEAIGCFVQDGLSLEAAVIKAYPMFEGAFVGVV